MVCLIVFEFVLTPVIHANRQRHLGAELLIPKPNVRTGEVLALLQSRAIHLNEIVVEGDGTSELRSGPGHRPGTPLPGQPGDSLLTALRQRYGGPFARLDELSVGDSIEVRTRDARILEFIVTEKRRVGASEVQPPPTGETVLTLVTTVPGWFSRQRLVVDAKLAASTGPPPPKAAATPPALSGAGGVTYAPAGPGIRARAEILLWLLVLSGVLLAGRWVHRRRRPPLPVMVVLLVPVVSYALLQVMLSSEFLVSVVFS